MAPAAGVSSATETASVQAGRTAFCSALYPIVSDQAIALRQRWLCHSSVAFDDTVEQLDQRLWIVARMRRCRGPRLQMSPSKSMLMTNAIPLSISRALCGCEFPESRRRFSVAYVSVQSNQYPRAPSIFTRIFLQTERPRRHRRLSCQRRHLDTLPALRLSELQEASRSWRRHIPAGKSESRIVDSLRDAGLRSA